MYFYSKEKDNSDKNDVANGLGKIESDACPTSETAQAEYVSRILE